MILCVLLLGGCQRSATGPASPGRIRGRLSATEGSLANIRVFVREPHGSPGSPKAVTRTNPNGQFEISGLSPGEYVLESDVDGRMASVSLLVQPGETVSTVLRLHEPVRLTGRVVDRKGTPVPSALVLTWKSGETSNLARETTTNEEGVFAFDKMGSGDVTVLIQSGGIGSVKWDRITLPTRPLKIQLEGVGVTVSGAVIGLRQGEGGATVRLGGSGLRAGRTASTDSSGRFRFHGLGPGDYALRAGTVVQASKTLSVSITDQDLSKIELTMGPGESVSGNVIDGKRTALAGAIVVVQAVPGDDCPEIITADVVGYFSSIALPRGAYQVSTRSPGFVAEAPQLVQVNGRPPVLSLQLFRAGRVLGRLQTLDGKPASGAEVSITTPSGPRYPRDRLPVVVGPLPLAAEAAALGTQLLPHVVRTRATTTDSAGNFSLGELRPGSYGLLAGLEGVGQLSVPPRPVREGTATDFGTLTLQPPEAQPSPQPASMPLVPGAMGGIEGEVVDEQGRFLQGAEVSLRRGNGEEGPPVSMSGAGFRVFGVQEGTWTLVAKVGDRTTQVSIQVPASKNPKVPSVRNLRIKVP